MLRYSLPLLRISPVCLVLGTLMTGCVTTQEPAGTFTTGGSGTYGSPAPGTELPPETNWFGGLFGGKKADAKKNQQLHLAYAAHEEAKGNAAAARKAYDEQRESYAAARKSYQHVLTLNEKSVDAIVGLARLDEVAGRTAEAEQGFQKAVRLESSSPRTLDALGQFYANQARWNDALPTLQKALAGSPDDKSIRYHYAVALAKAGQLEQAQPLLVDAVGVATAHYNLGVIQHERGELVASEEHFSQALLENPRFEPAQRWLTDVRRELSERGRMAQGKPAANDGNVPAAAATTGGGTRPAEAGQAASPRAHGAQQIPATANQPRRIQQTSGMRVDEAAMPSQRPSAPVSPLTRK